MSIATLAAIAIATLLGGWTLEAQEAADSGPTVTAARAAFFAPGGATRERSVAYDTSSTCGSALKNAAMLGLGFSLAASILELTYTIVREPLVRRGHNVPAADPALIAWAGGAGFVLGLIGTERCRRRHR